MPKTVTVDITIDVKEDPSLTPEAWECEQDGTHYTFRMGSEAYALWLKYEEEGNP